MPMKTIKTIGFLTLVFLLSGCFPFENPAPPAEEPDPETVFDYGAINYNEEYRNPEDESEKGFHLYDYVDFNLLDFGQRDKKHILIYVRHEDDPYESQVLFSYAKGAYLGYQFKKTGVYHVTINSTLYNVRDEFSLNVRAGGYPSRIDIEIRDADGKLVQEVKGGGTYDFTALVYSDETLLPSDTDKFSSWFRVGDAQGEEGERTVRLQIPNQRRDGEIPVSMSCTFYHDEGSKPSVFDFSVPCKNNYLGIELTNAVPEALDLSHANSFPLSYYKAEHVYENGEREPVELVFGKWQDNTVVPLVKYEGEESEHFYLGKAVTNPMNLPNNFANGVSYYFPKLDKKSAQIYLAYCYVEKSSYKRIIIPESVCNLRFTNPVPETLQVTGIEGREFKHFSYDNRYPSFVREVVDNAVQVKVRLPLMDKKYQYFSLNLEVDPFRDYYIFYDGNHFEYNHELRRFYPIKVGTGEIRIISAVNPEVKYSLFVKVVDPVEESWLKRKDDSTYIVGYDIFEIDLRNYFSVRERLYSDKERTRSIREDETVRLFVDGVEIQPGEVGPNDKVYASLFDKDGNDISKTSPEVLFILIPDLILRVNEEEIIMSSLPHGERRKNYLDIGGVSYYYEIAVPTLELAEGDTLEIIGSNNRADSSLAKQEYQDISYKIKIRKGFKTYEYNIRIVKIKYKP